MKNKEYVGILDNNFSLDNLGRMIIRNDNIIKAINGAIALDYDNLLSGSENIFCPYINYTGCVNGRCDF